MDADDLFERLGYQFDRARALAYAGDAYRAADEGGLRRLVQRDVAAARDAWTQALAILDNMDHPLANEVSTNLRQLAAAMTHV